MASELVAQAQLARIAEFVLEHARARAPHTWLQARRKAPLPALVRVPSVLTFAERHVRAVPELAVKGLWWVGSGFPVEVSTLVPTADQVLSLQARGRRCVSTLCDSSHVPEVDPLEFVLHDLCHLAKFADPEFHAEQVGFFHTLERAFASPSFVELESELDPQWQADRRHIASDMNGSSVFLFAVLKMKLKMAARRKLSRTLGQPEKTSGKLEPEEQEIFERLLVCLLDAMQLSGPLREAAQVTSARRDCPLAAARLADAFRQLGVAVLARHCA